MKKSTLNRSIYYLIGIAIFLLIWNIISFTYDENNLIFPGVIETFKEVINILKGSYIYKCLYYTLIRMTIGFTVSILIAIVVGTVAGINEKIKLILQPFFTVLKTVPTASLVFLFLVLYGSKRAPIYIVILICLPILYESVVSGLENIDAGIKDTLKLENGSKLIKIVKVELPLALDYLLVGIASSFGLSFKIEIMAEVLTGSTSNGLGSAINYIQKVDPTNMTGLFAYSFIAIITALIFDLIFNIFKEE